MARDLVGHFVLFLGLILLTNNVQLLSATKNPNGGRGLTNYYDPAVKSAYIPLRRTVRTPGGSNSFDSYATTEGDGSSSYASPNYKFEYGVQDGKNGNDFGHEEQRNGHVTSGQYRVRLPDGRLQVVTYTADKNGYKADVVYHPATATGGGGSYGYDVPVASGSGRNGRSSTNHGQANKGFGRGRSFATTTRMINGRTYHNDIQYY